MSGDQDFANKLKSMASSASETTILPDGSAFFTASFPLPKDREFVPEYSYPPLGNRGPVIMTNFDEMPLGTAKPSVDSVKVERRHRDLAYKYHDDERLVAELARDFAQAEARGAQGRAGGEEEQRWVKATALPSWLIGWYWLQFEGGSVGARPAERRDGAWFYSDNPWSKEHAPVVAFCEAKPPAPPSPTPGGEKEGA
jgi:hypothetical protein